MCIYIYILKTYYKGWSNAYCIYYMNNYYDNISKILFIIKKIK